MLTNESPPYREAVQGYLIKFCVPLVKEEQNQRSAIIQGSGSLFEYEGEVLFITAHHVIKSIDYNVIGIPVNRPAGLIEVTNGTDNKLTVTCDFEVYNIPAKEVYIHERKDIAILRISDQELIEMLRQTYSFIPFNITSLPIAHNNIIVVGFPSVSHQRIKDKYSFSPLYFETMRIETPPNAQDVEPEDIFLSYTEIQTLDGKYTPLIDLQGVSGGAIWQFDPSAGNQSIWNVYDRLKFIGINKSFIKGRHTRGLLILPFLNEIKSILNQTKKVHI